MRTFIQIVILLLFAGACSEKAQVKVAGLKCESKINPVGIDVEKPRFSWISESEQRGVSQSACQVFVASSREKLDENRPDLWDSKKRSSDKSIHIAYEGKPLESNKKYFWKVKIWNHNSDTHESEPASWITKTIFKQ